MGSAVIYDAALQYATERVRLETLTAEKRGYSRGSAAS